MARRYVHYEAAFEDYLRSEGTPYIAVDEAKKAIFSGSRVKSFDFLVYRQNGPNWLVDVKGRKFPYDISGSRRYWENWVMQEDLHDLHEWQQVFGEQFQAVFVFAYWITRSLVGCPFDSLHFFRSEYYAFIPITVADYGALSVGRSPKWNTVTVPARAFRERAKAI